MLLVRVPLVVLLAFDPAVLDHVLQGSRLLAAIACMPACAVRCAAGGCECKFGASHGQARRLAGAGSGKCDALAGTGPTMTYYGEAVILSTGTPIPAQ